MKQTVTILIADDHEMVRRGVRHTLETNPDWRVVGEAANGLEAVDLCIRLQPDLVVLDLSMPELNGLEALRQILSLRPSTRVLVLSLHDSDELIHEVLAAGAKGYLLKSDAARDMISAVQALVEGRVFFTAKVSQALLENYLRPKPQKAAETAPRLTAREEEIVRLVASGKTNKEIAVVLGISVRTVESHRSNIMEKLGLHSLSDLVLYAVRHGLVPSDSSLRAGSGSPPEER